MKTISRKGKPVYYDELKKIITVSLTPTATSAFDAKAKEAGLSRSEYLEQLARSLI